MSYAVSFVDNKYSSYCANSGGGGGGEYTDSATTGGVVGAVIGSLCCVGIIVFVVMVFRYQSSSRRAGMNYTMMGNGPPIQPIMAQPNQPNVIVANPRPPQNVMVMQQQNTLQPPRVVQPAQPQIIQQPQPQIIQQPQPQNFQQPQPQIIQQPQPTQPVPAYVAPNQNTSGQAEGAGNMYTTY